ncbi:MAG: DUF2791 family P-loop domain-containing protein, partial [Clostridiales bacterium]|nr:DUF2791 family P-loop domain-containing protein [Clostridiales bacterium]
IMHNLSLLDKGETETSFEDIFDRWINKVRSMPSENASSEINKILETLEKYNASFARALTYYIRARINDDKEFSGAIASWISGEKNIPSQLKTKFEVIGSVDKVNTMDFLKAFIKLTKFMGLEGLVILIDELELIMNERADIRLKAYENIRYIIDECAIGELRNVMFVFAATDELLTNPEKGTFSYEALYQRLGDPADKKSKVVKDLRQPVISLPKLSEDDMLEITKKILEMHKEVYNTDPGISLESITNWALYMYKDVEPSLSLKDVNLRKFIIKVLEILDAIEQNSNISLLRSELKRTDNNGELSFKAVPFKDEYTS